VWWFWGENGVIFLVKILHKSERKQTEKSKKIPCVAQGILHQMFF